MTTAWLKRTIREISIGLYDGPHATPAPAEEGPVFLGIGNVTEDGHLDLSSVRHIAEQDFGKWTKRVTPQPGDIVFTYEATLNRYAIIPEGFRGCLGRRMALIRPDLNEVDTRFLLYTFFASEWRQTIEANRLSGATVDRIPLTKFPGFPVRLPPLDTQRRIASILGAYDDLIEVNRRRVAVLEEMARGLFEEWFVRFRFPGHDSVPFVETPDGPLPQGWSTSPFGELFEQTIGGLWGEADASDEDDQPVRVIRGTDFPRLLSGDFESVPKRFVKAKELRKRTIAAGDLILEASGGSKDQPVGRTQFVTHGLLEGLGNVVAPASFCRKLRPKTQPGLAEYAHGLLLAMYEDRRIEKFQKQSTGLRNLSMRQLEAEPITVPAASHLAAFGSTVRPLLDAMSIHRNEMRLLRCSRDMLLPRLVSGQLSVEAAERDLELAA